MIRTFKCVNTDTFFTAKFKVDDTPETRKLMGEDILGFHMNDEDHHWGQPDGDDEIVYACLNKISNWCEGIHTSEGYNLVGVKSEFDGYGVEGFPPLDGSCGIELIDIEDSILMGIVKFDIEEIK